jgi:hypothetical protein
VISGLRVQVRLTSRDALRMFDLADIWAARNGKDVRLVSANDHVHSRGSAHYEGKALDFQSSDNDGLSETFRLAGYRVLWKVPGHFGHVHVEHMGASGALPEPPASMPPPRHASARRAKPTSRVGG